MGPLDALDPLPELREVGPRTAVRMAGLLPVFAWCSGDARLGTAATGKGGLHRDAD